MKRAMGVALSLWVLGAIAGCRGNNAALCRELEVSVEDRMEECGSMFTGFRIVWPECPSCTCDDVNRINEPEEMIGECLPWLAQVSCEEFDESNLPQFCDGMHFVVVYQGELPSE